MGERATWCQSPLPLRAGLRMNLGDRGAAGLPPLDPHPGGCCWGDHPGCHRGHRHRATCKQLYNRGRLVGAGGPVTHREGRTPGGNRPPPGAGAWCAVVPPASDELVGCAVLGCPEASSGVPEQGPSFLSVVERPVQLPSYPVQLNKPVTECLPRGLPRARSDRSVCNQPCEAVTGPPDRRGTREVLGSSCGPHVAGGPRAPPLL